MTKHGGKNKMKLCIQPLWRRILWLLFIFVMPKFSFGVSVHLCGCFLVRLLYLKVCFWRFFSAGAKWRWRSRKEIFLCTGGFGPIPVRAKSVVILKKFDKSSSVMFSWIHSRSSTIEMSLTKLCYAAHWQFLLKSWPKLESLSAFLPKISK